MNQFIILVVAYLLTGLSWNTNPDHGIGRLTGGAVLLWPFVALQVSNAKLMPHLVLFAIFIGVSEGIALLT